ncbi:MAG: YkgJ family cysteine cluster protein [Desulfobacteraceae bacterium]|nr:MAG: YkgJ family cysteine cluster protein [Desulfobacteraceae bacterium]
MKPLSAGDFFAFSCHRRVSCFNDCCRELNQYLTPYDILRLKNHLGLCSGDFLKKYTVQYIGPQSGFPMVSFRADGRSGAKCPFVAESGCSVYEDRPSSCRIYPLVRIVSRSRESGAVSERYMLLKEDHCFGFEEMENHSVKSWIECQRVAEYNAMNDLVLELISLKNTKMPGPLKEESKHLLRLALFDIDGFRAYADEGGVSTEPQRLKEMSDADLLRFAVEWTKKAVFGA